MNSMPSLHILDIEQLQANRQQPRKYFAKDKLEELAQTIRQFGILQPLVVKPLSARQYQIIAGERRWRAAQLAQLEKVPCLIQTVDDAQMAAMALIENLQREALNPIEEAHALQQLMWEFELTQEELAEKVGCSRAKVAHSLRLLKCQSTVQAQIREGILSEGHGKVLAGLPEHQQLQLAHRCSSQQWSVRQLERAVRQLQQTLTSQSSKKADPDVTALLRQITEQLGTEVRLELDGKQKKGGWMKIRYFNDEVLAGILERLGIKFT